MQTLGETLYKIPLQYEAFRQHFKPTKAQIKAAHYKTGLSDYEIMLIHAYSVQRAFERLEKLDIKPVDRFRLEHEFYWLKSWHEISVDEYGKTINHLVEVCAWHSENGFFYFAEWMLEAEKVIYDRVLDFLYKGRRQTFEKKSYDDIKQRIGDI